MSLQTNVWTGVTGEADLQKTEQAENWDKEPQEPCLHAAPVSFWF